MTYSAIVYISNYIIIARDTVLQCFSSAPGTVLSTSYVSTCCSERCSTWSVITPVVLDEGTQGGGVKPRAQGHALAV